MEPFIGPIISGLVSAILAAFGCYVAVTNRLTKLETLIEDLKSDVEKHNSLVERTYRAEQDITNADLVIPEFGGVVNVAPAGNIVITCMNPNLSIATTTELWIRGTYILA